MATLKYEGLTPEARELAVRLAEAYVAGDLEWQFKIILTLRGDDVGSVWLFGSRNRNLIHARDITPLKQLVAYDLLDIEMDEKRSMYVSLTKPLFTAVDTDFQEESADEPALPLGEFTTTTGEFRQAMAVTIFGTAGAIEDLLRERNLLTPELRDRLSDLRADPSEHSAAQHLPPLFSQAATLGMERSDAATVLHWLYQFLQGVV